MGTRVAAVYDRIARIYDVMEAPMDLFGGARRRERVVSSARGRVLEIGIGTGRNLEHYPDDVVLTGIDISPAMLRRARVRESARAQSVSLILGDAEKLSFADESFDTVLATCVFCSVPDPVRGLQEVMRVVRRDGQVLLLEHVRPRNPVLGTLADLITPITRRLMGPEVNRRTEENVARAGLAIIHVRREGIWREIVARRPDA